MQNKKVNYIKSLTINICIFLLWFVHGCSTKNLIQTEKVGSIFVESNIPGANIILDNVTTDKHTPDTLFNIRAGSHLIEVEKEGYLPSPTSIIVEVKADTIVQASFLLLDLNYGSLWVDSNVEGACIAIDHVYTDKLTPFLFDHNIPVGTHIVSVFKEGHSNDAPAKEVDSITTEDTVEVNFVLNPAEVGRAMGDITPDFELEDDYGTWHRLYAYRGFVTMINFWATDCSNCMKELPYLQEIYTKYDADSLIIFGINYGGSFGVEGFDQIRQTREQKSLEFILLKGGETGVKSDYEVTDTPVTIILDRGGKIYYYMVGFKASWEEKLKQKLDELFGK
jgi:thiol-disulfide isomerase/thioredoxin